MCFNSWNVTFFWYKTINCIEMSLKLIQTIHHLAIRDNFTSVIWILMRGLLNLNFANLISFSSNLISLNVFSNFIQLLLGRGSLCSGFKFLIVRKFTSFSRKPALSAIWFSFMRRASRDRFAAMLFFLRRAQYLSSFKSSGTNCGRKRKREKEHKNVRTLVLIYIAKKHSSNGVYPDGWQIWRRKPRREQQYNYINEGSPASAISWS